MRKLYQLLFFTCLLSSTNSLHGQVTKRFYLNYGIKGVSLDEKLITFGYVDDSPSRDNLFTEVTAESFSNPQTVSLGGIFPIASVNRLAFKGQLDGYFRSGFYGLSAEIGGGYELFSTGKLHLSGDLFFGYNRTSLKLGQIVNNSVFIQINDQQFFEESLNVRFENSVISIRPNLALALDLLGPLGLYSQIGYNARLSTNDPEIVFIGTTERESVALDDPDASLTIDGQSSNEALVDFGGLTINIGLSYAF